MLEATAQAEHERAQTDNNIIRGQVPKTDKYTLGLGVRLGLGLGFGFGFGVGVGFGFGFGFWVGVG